MYKVTINSTTHQKLTLPEAILAIRRHIWVNCPKPSELAQKLNGGGYEYSGHVRIKAGKE